MKVLGVDGELASFQLAKVDLCAHLIDCALKKLYMWHIWAWRQQTKQCSSTSAHKPFTQGFYYTAWWLSRMRVCWFACCGRSYQQWPPLDHIKVGMQNHDIDGVATVSAIALE